MKFIQFLILFCIVYESVSLRCHDCGRVLHERCEKNINLPKRDCDEPTLEEKEKLGLKAVCIKTTRTLLKNNMTFYERQCGMHQPENSTCAFLESNHEDDSTNFECMECEKDFCNGARASHITIMSVIIKTLSILFIKLF